MQLSQRSKKILRWVGYPLLAIFTFLVTLHLTFPYERLANKLIVEPLSAKYDVTIISVKRTLLPGGLILEGLVLRTRPTKPDELPTTTYFDEVRIDVGLLSLLNQRIDVDIVAVQRLQDGLQLVHGFGVAR